MTDILLKYKQLNKTSRQEVLDFIDFLLSKQGRRKNIVSHYKSKLLKVSIWAEPDLDAIKEGSKSLNKWEVEDW